MEFEWDEGKRAANLAKHGFDFAAAPSIWSRPMLDPYDTRLVGDELRRVAVGIAGEGETIVVVVYTMRETARRIISLRRARDYERTDYRSAFGRGV